MLVEMDCVSGDRRATLQIFVRLVLEIVEAAGSNHLHTTFFFGLILFDCPIVSSDKDQDWFLLP